MNAHLNVQKLLGNEPEPFSDEVQSSHWVSDEEDYPDEDLKLTQDS
jgi:hypothetical protein